MTHALLTCLCAYRRVTIGQASRGPLQILPDDTALVVCHGQAVRFGLASAEKQITHHLIMQAGDIETLKAMAATYSPPALNLDRLVGLRTV